MLIIYVEVNKVDKIKRIEIDEVWADAALIEAGDFVYTSYCMKNEGKNIDRRIFYYLEDNV